MFAAALIRDLPSSGRLVRRGAAVVPLAVVVALAAACGSQPSSPAAGPAAGTPPAAGATADRPDPATSPSGRAAAPDPASPTSTPATRRCVLAQLNVVTGVQDAGAGHRGLTLVFRNTGPTPCWLRGYPGVDGLDGAGRTLAHAARTRHGYLGGTRDEPSTVLLRPGGSASAMVEALGFRAADGSACAPFATLLVTPPEEVRSVRLRWDTDACSALEVHPVVPGTSGSA